MSESNVNAAVVENEVVENEVATMPVEDVDIDEALEDALSDGDDDDVEPGEEEATSTDGRSNRTKKLVYPVPATKLPWPWDESLIPWSLDYTKLKEDDFQTSEGFLYYECKVYLQSRIDRVEADYLAKIKPLRSSQEAILAKIEDSKAICAQLGLETTEEKEAVGEVLGTITEASGKSGLSLEALLNVVMLLKESKDKSAD